MKRLLFLFSLFAALTAGARSLPVHCPDDSAKIVGILQELKTSDLDLGDKLVFAAKSLQGAGRDTYYSTDSLATLRLNVDSVTPMTFINNVIALAKASERPGLVDLSSFAREFENISSRRGEYTGFPSIMYHSSDWIGDNIARGNVVELTENYPGMIARTKSLDEMTRKRHDYAVLADSATFESVRMVEMGFRTHRVPTLKKEIVKKKELQEDLRNGDIIILVPSGDGVDFYDMGIVALEDDGPHLIHLSPQLKAVVEEKDVLPRYFDLMTKYFQGFRLLRLKD